ncbi:hypothetical protein [Primorskyibacter sp. 2E233]|uniref:hypothetical protein n=1 Tax=Primorskyibacter sp. 2E233 TaxID=3413431 RepID=UPI003BF43F33
MADFEIDELERDATRQRAKVNELFQRLSDTANPARAGQDAMQTGADWAQDAASAAALAAKAHPAALALIGAGAALLLSQSAKRDQPEPEPAPMAPTAADTSPDARSLELAMESGLEPLPDGARGRVLAARQKALDAQRALEKHAAQLGETAKRSHTDHPLITGALALGFGAVAGALLPSTRKEGALLGARRDAALREAEAMLHREISALQARASNAPNESDQGPDTHV